MKNRVLSDWVVVSLRPVSQHSAIRAAASRLGARLFAMSPIRLSSLKSDNLSAALAAPIRIFTSPAAARFADAQSPGCLPGNHAITLAVGSGTAHALNQLGVQSVKYPVKALGADGLLKLAELQSIQGKRIGLITAPAGRAMLEQQIELRGGEITAAYVYQREAISIRPARWQQWRNLPSTSAILVSSLRSFDGFWHNMDQADQNLCRSRWLVASSARIEEFLRAQGFRHVIRAQSALSADMLAAVECLSKQDQRESA